MGTGNGDGLSNILVFGGTYEGRELVEWLSALGTCRVVSCSATEYGGELVSGLPRVEAHVGPLDDAAKERLLAERAFSCIVDATHPYATHVTASLARLAADHDVPLLRLVRDGAAAQGGNFAAVPDVEAAARAVARHPGNIMLTTGTKDLAAYVGAVPDFAERLYARVLPVVDSVAHARELGIPTSHIIAMQGPFSTELNAALFRALSIDVLVTKDSGTAGGFAEKLEAAALCDVDVVVIGRPQEEAGLSMDEAKRVLLEDFALAGPGGPGAVRAGGDEEEGAGVPAGGAARTVYLVGMGPGSEGMLVQAARDAIAGSDLLIGAKRLLEPYAAHPADKRALILAGDIADALGEGGFSQASVLFSGDVGFYSGATKLAEALVGDPAFDVRAIPGISSAVYFCARLLTPWQDAYLASAHGREHDPVATVREHGKAFMLTGGKMGVRDICAALAEAGLGHVLVHVGERLSYADERIVSGTAEQLAEQDFASLAVMLVENPDAPKQQAGELTA